MGYRALTRLRGDRAIGPVFRAIGLVGPCADPITEWHAPRYYRRQGDRSRLARLLPFGHKLREGRSSVRAVRVQRGVWVGRHVAPSKPSPITGHGHSSVLIISGDPQAAEIYALLGIFGRD